MPHSVGIGAEFGLLLPALVTGERMPRLTSTPNSRGLLEKLVPDVPPALVIDEVGPIGARERLERPDESPLIGTGIDWPLAATLMGGAGSLRVPLPLVLAWLSEAESNQTWRTNAGSWRSNPEHSPIDRLLATYLKRSAERLRVSSASADRVVVGVPNAMSLATMTRVLNVTGRSARFVWRPVAALISAIHSHPDDFSKVRDNDRALVIYMGIDGFEATVLHLIRRAGEKGPEIVVPGRLRVNSDNNVHRPLAGLLRWMRDRECDGLAGHLPHAWARAWVCQCTVKPEGLVTDHWLNGPWDPIERLQVEGPWGWFGQRVAARDAGERYRSMAASFRQEISGLVSAAAGLTRVVLAGGISSVDCELIQSVLRLIPKGCRVVHQQWGVVEGAALFGWREQMKWATYSDYLPQLDLCVERDGNPLWLPVVQSEWIDAGVPYRNQQTGFRLQRPASGKTSRQVELAVAMEGHGHVRETQDVVHFPLESRSEDVPLTIQIEVQAASGEPRVTAEPQGDIPSIVLDWGIATSTNLSKEEYLASRPRSFPPIEIVRAARWWHQPVQYRTISTSRGVAVTPKQYVVSELLPGLKRGVIDRKKIGELRKHVIRRLWNRDEKVWEALTSTDGAVQFHQDVLNELRNGLFAWLVEHLGPRSKEVREIRRDVIKVLAWSGFQSANFERLIVERVKHEHDWIHAIGNAIVSPRRAAAAIGHLGELLKYQLDTQGEKEIQKINHPLKQLSWLLSQRKESTSEIKSEDMLVIATAAFECAVNLAKHGNFAVKFRWAVRCMLLCLMRRQHDREFLDPSTELAHKMSRFCGKLYLRVGPPDEMAQRVARDFHIGINEFERELRPPVARDLRTFIEYLERRGTGSIIVESDDDDD
jgi:hypothetical protein